MAHLHTQLDPPDAASVVVSQHPALRVADSHAIPVINGPSISVAEHIANTTADNAATKPRAIKGLCAEYAVALSHPIDSNTDNNSDVFTDDASSERRERGPGLSTAGSRGYIPPDPQTHPRAVFCSVPHTYRRSYSHTDIRADRLAYSQTDTRANSWAYTVYIHSSTNNICIFRRDACCRRRLWDKAVVCRLCLARRPGSCEGAI